MRHKQFPALECTRINAKSTAAAWEDYRIGPPPKSTLICLRSMQKGLGLGLGWRSDSVVFPAAFTHDHKISECSINEKNYTHAEKYQ